jgi:hypothetical protein
MDSSWYLLRIKPKPKDDEGAKKKEDAKEEKKKAVVPEGALDNKKVEKKEKDAKQTPLVGSRVVYLLGQGTDEKIAKDKKNPLWEKIQDGVRPAWAPDFLRLGYAIVFKREGLPRLAVRLGIKSPENAAKVKSRKRVLTFDDVTVAACLPYRKPFYMPSLTLAPEAWWLGMKDSPRVTSPYLAPGGVQVVNGEQRLADVVATMLRTAHGYPRQQPQQPGLDYSEFITLSPILPAPRMRPADSRGPESIGRDAGYSGIELFRW